jgi:hypothetical protein
MERFNKLLNLLRVIEKNEIKEITRYIEFFFDSKKQQAVQLFQFLRAAHPKFDATHAAMQASKVCQVLAVNEAQLTYIASDLVGMLEEYLSYKVYTETKKVADIYLPEAFEQRGLNKYVPTIVKHIQTDLSRNALPNDRRLLYQYWCSETIAQHTDDKQEDKKALAVKQMFDALENWYNYQILSAAAIILNDKLFKNYSYELPDNFEQVIQKLAQQTEHLPIIALYYNICQLFLSQQQLLQLKEQSNQYSKKRKDTHKTDLAYQQLEAQKEAISQQQGTLFSHLLTQIQVQSTSKIDPPTLPELREWYSYALNFCYLKYNEGNPDYIIKVFDLYELIIGKQLLLNEQQEIEEEQYRNIIKINVRLKRLEYAARFMNNYRRFLPDNIRSDAYRYANALVALGQSDYAEALSHLIRIKSSDISYRTDISYLEIICYYEQNTDEQLENRLNSFSLYLDKNKKITSTLYQPYKLFINIVRRLWQIKNELAILRYKEMPRYATLENINQLQQEIENLKHDWLLNKAKELSLIILTKNKK